MIISEGYALTYYSNDNRIVINIPQTGTTARTTMLPIEKRKDIKESDLAFLLTMTKIIFKNWCGARMEVDNGSKTL